MADDNARAEVIRELVSDSVAAERELERKLELQRLHTAFLRDKLEDSAASESPVPSSSRSSKSDNAVDVSGLNPNSGFPKLLKAVLERAGRPLTSRELADAMERIGVVTESERGIAPQISAALSRRKDLFVSLRRGVWDLASRHPESAKTGEHHGPQEGDLEMNS